MIKKRSSLYLRYSIWLTALIVIALIILLALTVYYVRERAIIDLFSSQQASLAYQSASRIEESIARCEKDLSMLPKLLPAFAVDEAKKREEMKALFDDLKEIVLTVVEIDKDDVVVYGYPENLSSKLYGKKIEDASLYHVLKKMNQRFTGEISGFHVNDGENQASQSKTIGIGLPVLSSDHTYEGAVLAILSPQLLIKRFMSHDQTHDMSTYWLLDESGMIVYHPDQRSIGKNIAQLTPQGNTLFRMFSYTSQHYNEMILNEKGEEEKCIIAYAPIRIGITQWWVVLVTPYDEVLKPIRSASLNIIWGAIGLIVVVIITTISIARADVRRLRLKEELKRLKEREEWQGKLLREKMTIEGIVEGSPVPTFVLNKSHRVIFWNRACTDLTGYSSVEMINTDNYYKPFYKEKRPFLADFIIDHNVETFETYYGEGKVRKSESIEGAYEAVKYFKNLSGKERHLHFIAAPIFDEKGDIVAAIETFLDVSKEVELTKNLQEYAENLQNELEENIRLRKEVEELYNYLNSIIESLPDKIFDLNRDGIINFVSRRIHKGRRGRTDPEGKHFTEYVSPEHKDYVISKWEDAKKGIFKPYELETIDHKGVKRYLLLTPSPVKGTDRFVLVQRDITEMKDLEKKYYESQKLAAIGQLSAGIAHEVRNPLSSIKMSLQILEKRMQPEGNDLKRFKIAQREVEHLEKLVSDVLIYAKPSDPHKEHSDVKSIIEGSLAMVEKSVKDKDIDIRKRYAEGIGAIPVDPHMITQALINIFQNAIDAMEPGGRLVISLRNEDDALVIEIEDNGCGIDEEDLPYLYNPFFTKKNYGTGLGLTQVKKIIDQHDGEIEIKSKKGEGTRFIITLPKGDA
jgi:PAS domain S-box-containing protein